MRPPYCVCLLNCLPNYFFFAAFFATFLAAFFVAIVPVLPVIKRVRCSAFIAANRGIVFVKKSVKKNRWFNAFFLVHKWASIYLSGSMLDATNELLIERDEALMLASGVECEWLR